MERFLLVLFSCIVAAMIFYKQIIDLIFWVWDKFDDIFNPPDKLTRDWEAKDIVNNMWIEENRSTYFVQEEVDKVNDGIKKLNSIIENSTVDDFDINSYTAKWSIIGLYYGLLEHIKEECKTPEFIEQISIAIENDIAFVEALKGKKLNNMDDMGFGFVKTLLRSIKNKELSDRFAERILWIEKPKK